MGLARIKTWLAGDVLTAADLNAEFNNPLNNPITLISPTTGAINFQSSVAHTNLVITALNASSGSVGSVLILSTAAAPIPLWSSGSQAGALFGASTGNVPTWIPIGGAGNVLITASSGMPTWGSSASLAPSLLSGTTGAAGAPLIASTAATSVAVYSTGINVITTSRMLAAQRIGMAGQGTAWTTANISLSGGWSTAGTVQGVRGGDLGASFQVVTSGIGAGQPGIQTTYADGVFQTVPVTVFQLGTTSTGTPPFYSITQNSSGVTIVLNSFSLASGQTYTFNLVTIG